MNIQIKRARLAEVSSSIGCYIFKEIRDKDVSHNMEWLCHICGFYKKLLELNQREQSVEQSMNGYIAVDINDNFANSLAELISKYLYSEANELVDDDLEWLCEMVYIFNQLKKYKLSNTSDSEQEIKKNNDNIDTLDEQDLKQKEEIKDIPKKLEPVIAPVVQEPSRNSFFMDSHEWDNNEDPTLY